MNINHFKSLMLYFLSYMSLYILKAGPNFCFYKYVGIYVIDLHKQIRTACFLSLSLARIIP